MKYQLLTLFCAFALKTVCAQIDDKQRMTTEQYIEIFNEVAIYEMQRGGVPASIILAQAILESESGNSYLTKKSNNHFGIKCKTGWEGKKTYHNDDEKGECFRVYESARESYKDHTDFLLKNPRYSSLFSIPKEDYISWANGLKAAGYATNPKYPQLLINIIEKYDLNKYTNSATKKIIVNQDYDDKAIIKTNNEQKKNSPNREQQNKVDKTVTAKQENTTPKAEPFTIDTKNGKKCVFVAKGVAALVVAEKFKLKLNKLIKYNPGLQEGLLSEDKWLYLEN